jgi:glycosyltransferase involved in cell wall biosynthesis
MSSPSKKILFVGQLPPPFHGQAVVNGLVFEAEWQSFEKVVLPMEYSKTIDDVGSAGFSKVIHLISLILKTWKIWLVERPDAIYYPPASAHKVPVLRDIIYLGCTRFLFKKTVFHFHAGGLGQYLDSIGLLGKLAKWVYRKPDLAIELYREADSPGEYLGAKKVSIVPNGLAVEGEAASMMEGTDITMMFVGSLREDKGVLDVIRTVTELKKRGSHVRVQLAGGWVSEDFRKEAEALVKELEVEDRIEWLGIIQGDVKWAAFRRSHCFFFPTFYHSEKFPLVLIEALGMGLPVVSTNWRGIPQLLEGSDAAAIHEVGDVEGFANAIQRLDEDREKCRVCGANARSHYEKNYNLEKFLGSMEKCLEAGLKL